MDELHICNTLDATLDFISYILLCARNGFPPEDDMTLKKAFSELRYGVYQRVPVGGDARRILAGIDEAERAYELGDFTRGGHRLQDVEELLMALVEE